MLVFFHPVSYLPKLRHQETGKTWAFGQSRHVVAWMQTNITFVCQWFSVLRFAFGKHGSKFQLLFWSQFCHSKGPTAHRLVFACLCQGIRFGRGNLQRGSRDLEADTTWRNRWNYIVELLKHFEKLKEYGRLMELSDHLECLFWTSWPLHYRHLPTSYTIWKQHSKSLERRMINRYNK